MAEGLAADVDEAILPNARSIYSLITANNIDGIRSLLNPLTLRRRQMIVSNMFSNKTLLGYACKLGFRDIVKYLLDECEADVSERYVRRLISSPPLQISIANMNVSILWKLISRGAIAADKREAKLCLEYAIRNMYFTAAAILLKLLNKTQPLDDIYDHSYELSWTTKMQLNNMDLFLRASARGDIGRMKTLLSEGINARVINFSEDNALCMAINNGQRGVEHFLLNYRVFSVNEHVQALELCGAKFLAFKKDLEKGFHCWRKSLRIRDERFFDMTDFGNKLQTNSGLELISEKQLDALADHEADLYVQALRLFFRLLSPNSEVLHIAHRIVAQHPVFHKDLLRAISLLANLSKALHSSGHVNVYSTNTSIESLDCLLRHHFHCDLSDMGDFLLKFGDLISFINSVQWDVLLSGSNQFYNFVYAKLLSLVLKNITAMKHFKLSRNDELWIKDGISRILERHSNPYTTTLLHLAIEEPTAPSLVSFILSCSADANCTNHLKSTPMHEVSLLKGNESQLVRLLADAGGHIDAVNKCNKTPLMALKSKGVIKNPLEFLSLQCLAAQTIHKNGIPVPEGYPKILASFIKLHSV